MDEPQTTAKLRRATDFEACPRYAKHELSDEQIAAIAEAAALRGVEIARNNFYREVGEGVVKRAFIFIGAAAVAAWSTAKYKGWI